jgi:type II secretory pathway component PulC
MEHGSAQRTPYLPPRQAGNLLRHPRDAILTAMDRVALIALFAIAGCASAPPPRAATPVAEAAPAPDAVPAPAPAPAPEKPARPGAIPRADLERVLAQSPGAFLSHIDSAPTFQGRRFSGWRLNAFFPGDPRFGGALQAGDVVTRVNGQSIEQPEQFMQVWEGARFRRDLTVDILRDGRPRTLSWQIVD